MPDAAQDTIREAIISRAESLGLTAYAVWQQVKEEFPESKIDVGTVKRYTTGKVSLNSRYVSQICSVLGLELRPVRKPKSKSVG